MTLSNAIYYVSLKEMYKVTGKMHDTTNIYFHPHIGVKSVRVVNTIRLAKNVVIFLICWCLLHPSSPKAHGAMSVCLIAWVSNQSVDRLVSKINNDPILEKDEPFFKIVKFQLLKSSFCRFFRLFWPSWGNWVLSWHKIGYNIK